MKIVVPMAGRGSRFASQADKNPEYKKPKPLIMIKGKPMIAWAIKSLIKFNVSPKDMIFISLESQQKEYRIIDKLKKLFSSEINVVLVPKVTRGAVETALAAKQFMRPEEDLIITDSDHYFDGTNLYKAVQENNADIAGMIPVFLPPDEEIKWSYSLFDKETHMVSAVAEKDPKLAARGAYANIGGYYFSSGSIFIEQAEDLIRSGRMYGPYGKQEFYVAPMYQRMIDSGLKVQVAITSQVWGLGTPKDVEYFERNFRG